MKDIIFLFVSFLLGGILRLFMPIEYVLITILPCIVLLMLIIWPIKKKKTNRPTTSQMITYRQFVPADNNDYYDSSEDYSGDRNM